MPQSFPYKKYNFGVYFLFPKFNFNGSFQSVSGLGFNAGTEERLEGGLAGFKHQLTDVGTYSKLTLKRGFTEKSDLYEWAESTHNTLKATPCNILVSLLNKQGFPEKNWLVFHAIPKSWSAGELEATSSDIMIETITFSYQNFILI